MTKKFIFILLMSGIILSPMGAYAMDDEGGAPGTSISRPYRVPVTVLPSGNIELPSGTIVSPNATARDVLKEMTQKDKEIGQALGRKSLQPGTTYFAISTQYDAFESAQRGNLFPGFWQLKGALETIKESTQQPGASPHVGGSSSTPSAAPVLRPELEAAD